MYPEQATQPTENVERERRIDELAAYHAMRLGWQTSYDMKYVLLGRRIEFKTWDKEGCAMHLDQFDLADVIVNELPDDFLAKALVMVLDGDEALRADLKGSLEPVVNEMVKHHIASQSRLDAIQDLEEQEYDHQR